VVYGEIGRPLVVVQETVFSHVYFIVTFTSWVKFPMNFHIFLYSVMTVVFRTMSAMKKFLAIRMTQLPLALLLPLLLVLMMMLTKMSTMIKRDFITYTFIVCLLSFPLSVIILVHIVIDNAIVACALFSFFFHNYCTLQNVQPSFLFSRMLDA
jgi:hypothetical protein